GGPDPSRVAAPARGRQVVHLSRLVQTGVQTGIDPVEKSVLARVCVDLERSFGSLYPGSNPGRVAQDQTVLRNRNVPQVLVQLGLAQRIPGRQSGSPRRTKADQ